MNELQYEELLNYVKNIKQFKKMVCSESKRPIAVRALMHIAGVDKHTAWEFVSEYYERMDVGLTMNKPHSFLNVSILSTMRK